MIKFIIKSAFFYNNINLERLKNKILMIDKIKKNGLAN